MPVLKIKNIDGTWQEVWGALRSASGEVSGENGIFMGDESTSHAEFFEAYLAEKACFMTRPNGNLGDWVWQLVNINFSQAQFYTTDNNGNVMYGTLTNDGTWNYDTKEIENVDLTGYATESYVNTQITTNVPKKVSELTNDSNYITASGAPVQSVNGKTGTIQLNASDVGALPDTTNIPTVPTNVSAFTNDAGYLTEHQSLDGLATESYVDDAVIGAQSDWNAAEGEAGHVKNRTHWEESSLVEVLPETTYILKNSSNIDFETPLGITLGKTYIVNWNGVEYKCEPYTVPLYDSGYEGIVIGDYSSNIDSLPATGEPFGILELDAETAAALGFSSIRATIRPKDAVSGEHYECTISIAEVSDIVHKLDPKFLPDGLPYVEQGGSGAEILPECQPTYDGDGFFMIDSAFAVEIGKTYIVKWNGVEYTSTAIDGASMDMPPCPILINDGTDMETGEGVVFVIVCGGNDGNSYFATASDGSTEVTLSIFGGSEIVHKLDPKFLPDGVPYIESGGKVELPIVGFWADESGGEGTEFIFYTNAPIGLEIGKTYTVNWNGADYEVIGQDAMEVTSGELPGVFLGNQAVGGGADTGEPFIMYEFPAEVAAEMGVHGVVGGLDGAKADFAIYGVGETVHKLDNRCLDLEWLPTRKEILIGEEKVVTGQYGADSRWSDLHPTLGQKLAVYFNGKRYLAEVKKRGSGTESYTYAGNFSLFGSQTENTGEPFCLLIQGIGTTCICDGESTVSIYEAVPDKMPAEFLPDGVPYIENKGLQTVLPETTFTGLSGTTPISITNIPLTANSTYVVNWNGTTYNCVALGTGNQLYIGNVSVIGGNDTGEPFLLINNCNESISEGLHANLLAFDGSTEATMSIATEEIVFHKIDDKLLPTRIGDVAGKSFVVNGETVTAGTGAEIFNDYDKNIASGKYSHAEGNETIASGDYSHAEGGWDTTASGESSHAEGNSTTASGTGSHAEGGDTTASGSHSHAEGNFTTASGINSHAEGSHTTASNSFSHAEGSWTTASGVGSHAEGDLTTASGENQHVQGKCNIADSTKAHIVGNGTYKTPSNAHTLDWDGNAWFAGDVYVGSTSGTNRDEGSVKLATEAYVNDVVAEAQADWNAVEGEPGHVLNRTHWSESNGVLLEETNATTVTHPTFGQMWFIKQAPNLEVGKTYTVKYNGEAYTCVCQSAPAGLIQDPNAVAMGNFSVVGGANTGEPFAMLISNAFKEIDIIDLTGAASVRVEIRGEVYHKLDPNFLPVLVVKFMEREDGKLVSTSHTYQQMENAVMDGVPVVCIVKYSDGFGGSTAFLSCHFGDSLISGVKLDPGLEECTWHRASEYSEYYLDGNTSNKTIGNELWFVSTT